MKTRRLDPTSPAGIAAAAALTKILATLHLAVAARKSAIGETATEGLRDAA